jgi:hypothetical protein
MESDLIALKRRQASKRDLWDEISRLLATEDPDGEYDYTIHIIWESEWAEIRHHSNLKYRATAEEDWMEMATDIFLRNRTNVDILWMEIVGINWAK